jgi:hypothetical protein
MVGDSDVEAVGDTSITMHGCKCRHTFNLPHCKGFASPFSFVIHHEVTLRCPYEQLEGLIWDGNGGDAVTGVLASNGCEDPALNEDEGCWVKPKYGVV